ncbi:hypothetical protein CRYUN_Cryun17cG0134400 [Craigia yunnanensis]
MLLILPESPGWLVTRRKFLTKLRLAKRRRSSKRSGWAGSWKKLLLHPSPSIRRALIAVVGLNFFRNST